MLTDKHIMQHAEYLIEELTYPVARFEGMDDEDWDIIVQMYKKGYQDAIDEAI